LVFENFRLWFDLVWIQFAKSMKEIGKTKKGKRRKKEKNKIKGPRGNVSAQPDFWPAAHLPSPEPVRPDPSPPR
jgi:hypothetical protein